MNRTALVICLAAIMLLALSVPAFASPDGSSGTVYGKAVLAPYAIVLSGGGTDPGNPLTYQGNLSEWADEMYGNQVTVQNVGTQSGAIFLDVNTLPTAGSDTWDLTEWYGPSAAEWTFQAQGQPRAWALPSSSPYYEMYRTVDPGLLPGDSDSLQSRFRFPSSTGSTSDHYMSATISVADPGDSNGLQPPANQ